MKHAVQDYYGYGLLAVCVCFFILTACVPAARTTTPSSPSYAHTKQEPCREEPLPPSQRPYEINGIRYYPIPSAIGFAQDGIASWYGQKFHGRPTSSGELYDMYAMTAAHKTLPLGTHVKVTSKKNGKSIIVRVNDRGPFIQDRIIDLSYTAARSLEMVGPGTVPVRVEAIQVAQEHTVEGMTTWEAEAIPDFRRGSFTVQVGAFQTLDNAHKKAEIIRQEFDTVRVHHSRLSQNGYYRVQVGQFTDLIEAHLVASQLRDKGGRDVMVVALDNENGR